MSTFSRWLFKHATAISATSLTDLPLDVLLALFQHISDHDVISFLVLSRGLRIISLVTLLTRYRSLFILEEHIRLTSSSYAELQANLMSITKLECHISMDQRLSQYRSELTFSIQAAIASLPNVAEVHISQSFLQNGPFNIWPFVDAFLHHHKSESKLLVLRTSLTTSTYCRRRAVPQSIKNFAVLSSAFWKLLPTWRMYPQIMSPYTCIGSSQIISTSRISGPLNLLKEWTIVIVDPTLVSSFDIVPSPTPSLKWEHLLPIIHLPRLKRLGVENNSSVDASALCDFLCRHPSISALNLEHSSVHVNPVNGPPTWLLPNLLSLRAPLHLVKHILKGTNLKILSGVAIHVQQHSRRSKFMSYPKYDFEMLDDVLCMLADSEVERLSLMLPGGSVTKKWISIDSNTGARAETRLMHVRYVFVCHNGSKFHPEVLALFQAWLSLFPARPYSNIVN